MLLRYVKSEAERLKRAGSGQDDNEDEETQYKRLWYAPWKKVKVGGSAFKVCRPSCVVIVE